MNKDTKILHLDNKLNIGGTSKNAELLYKGLKEEGYDVQLASWEKGDRAEKLVEEGHEIFLPKSSRDLIEYLENENIDILHGHGGAFERLEPHSLDNVPYVVKTENFGWPDKDYIDHIDLILFPSKFTLLRYSIFDKTDIEKCQVLYHPLDIDELDSCRQIDIEGSPVVGKVGRSATGKWSSMTIEGFLELLKDFPNAQLVLLNPPNNIIETIEKKNIEENVEILEKIDLGKIGKFYNSIDVLAHSSRIGETFGYVIAESLACSTPVVTNSTPMRANAQIEIIEHGKNGFIANTPKAFSEAITSASKNHLNCKKSIEHLKLNKISEDLLELYSDMINEELEEYPLERFNSEYKKSLKLGKGTESTNYKMEKAFWDILTSLPIRNRLLYDIGRGLFQPGRKLHKFRTSIQYYLYSD